MSQEIPIYNFIIDLPTDVINSVDQNGIDPSWRLFNRGEVVWTLQTYMILKEVGFQSTYSKTLKRNTINIAHVDTLKRIGPQKDCYVVAITADKRPVMWSNYEIVQNMNQIKSKKQVYVTHWPQPGLIPRKDRQDQIRTVAYAGDPLNNCLKQTPIQEDLKLLGLTYKDIDQNNWNDFSQIDLLLAIRSFDGEEYHDKPASKLINGWLADVPVISSCDSAYRQIANPGQDYILVQSYNELIEAIKGLANNRLLYQNLIQNGRLKREKYTRELIAESWRNILVHQIKSDYQAWSMAPRIVRTVKYRIDKFLFICAKILKTLKGSIMNKSKSIHF